MVASYVHPTGHLAHNPGTCPPRESNPRPFDSQAGAQSTEPHQPGLIWPNLNSHTLLDAIVLDGVGSTFPQLDNCPPRRSHGWLLVNLMSRLTVRASAGSLQTTRPKVAPTHTIVTWPHLFQPEHVHHCLRDLSSPNWKIRESRGLAYFIQCHVPKIHGCVLSIQCSVMI